MDGMDGQRVVVRERCRAAPHVVSLLDRARDERYASDEPSLRGSIVKQRDKKSHRIYINTLRRMTPEQRLAKAFELTETSKALFREGLARRFPDLSDTELQRLYLARLEKCHNRNY